MKICSVCQRCYEDAAADCEENHGSLVRVRSGTHEITANYRLDFLLERDATGETYQATRSDLDQPFIVKLIPANLVGDTSRLEKIQSETRAIANLSHLNIARVYESGSTENGEFYTVTESINGQTLRECLRKVGVFPEAEAIMIARHSAEALEAAHSVGVVHRAVSPANIVLAQDGQKLAVKLQHFDFGSVKQESVVAASSEVEPPIDVLRYLSPEQCAGQETDARSDIYSLAVVLYEMLCGRSPFGAPTHAAIINRQINEQPLEQLGFDTRALLKDILRRSLQKRPETRPQTAGDFARQLRHIEQLFKLPGMTSREVAKSPTANEPTSVVFNDTPTVESGESPPENHQPRDMATQITTDGILPATQFATPSSFGKIEETTIDAAPSSESEPIRADEKEIGVKSFSAEPILIKKKESSVIPFESEPITVKKKFESEPIIDMEKQVDAPMPESAPIFIKQKKTDIAATTPRVIDLRDADVKETRETQTTAPIFANSSNENRVRNLSVSQPLVIGASLLVLLVSVLLGVLLYNRQHQQSTAPPTIASSSESQLPVPDMSGDKRESGVAEIEKPEPDAIENSPAIVSKRENQSSEETTVTDQAAKQNESAKNQTAGENPALTESDRDGNAETELSTSLERWVNVTNSRNVDQQMNYYAPKINAYYRTRNASPASVRAEKKRIFERADTVNIETGKPEITVSPDGKTATMLFRKKYFIKEGQQSRSGEVIQELQWVKLGNDWRIVSERDVRVINR